MIFPGGRRSVRFLKQSQTGVTEASTTRIPWALRQFGHRHEILGDGPFRGRTRIARQIAGARLNHHHLRFQADDILPKADQHLGRGLMADAPVQIRLSGKELRLALAPHLRDLVAQKNHAINARSRWTQLGILAAVAGEPTPVTQQTDVSGQLLLQFSDDSWRGLPFGRDGALSQTGQRAQQRDHRRVPETRRDSCRSPEAKFSKGQRPAIPDDGAGIQEPNHAHRVSLRVSSVSAVVSTADRWDSFLDAEAVQDAVVGVDVDPAVGHRETAPMVPSRDLLAAGPQLLAGLRIQRIQHGVRRLGNAPLHAEVQAHVRKRLRRVLAAAVGEDHAIGDHGRLGLIHVARNPRRRQLHFAVLRLHLERGDRALLDLAVLDRRLELGVLRSPERRQHPARSFRILPGRQRAPDAGLREVDHFIADERRAVHRRPMIVAADRLRVHEVEAALLAGVHHVLFALVVENGGRHLHVEIALDQPLGVGRSVIVHQVQTLGLGILLHADDAVAVESVLRIPAAVARSGVHGPIRADRRTGASPHAAARRSPTPHLVGGQIVGVGHVRIAAAALRAVRVDHVVEQVHGVRLAVGRHELRRRSDVLAVGSVHLPQAAIPRSRVDRVLARALRRGRSSRSPSFRRAKHARSAAAWRILKVLSKCLFQRSSPVATSMA